MISASASMKVLVESSPRETLEGRPASLLIIVQTRLEKPNRFVRVIGGRGRSLSFRS